MLRGLNIIERVAVTSDRSGRDDISAADIAAVAPEALIDPGGAGWPAIPDRLRWAISVLWQAAREIRDVLAAHDTRIDAGADLIAQARTALVDHERRIKALESAP